MIDWFYCIDEQPENSGKYLVAYYNKCDNNSNELIPISYSMAEYSATTKEWQVNAEIVAWQPIHPLLKGVLEWLYLENDFGIQCPVCGEIFMGKDFSIGTKAKYCPSCGIRLGGDEQ